ncbi:hypothetical protein HZB00_03815 [Candidatus Woesearchaeota archaeon]|nr:hypothetical protein [Candidatus Woesearchaeota archaeon]
MQSFKGGVILLLLGIFLVTFVLWSFTVQQQFNQIFTGKTIFNGLRAATGNFVLVDEHARRLLEGMNSTMVDSMEKPAHVGVVHSINEVDGTGGLIEDLYIKRIEEFGSGILPEFTQCRNLGYKLKDGTCVGYCDANAKSLCPASNVAFSNLQIKNPTGTSIGNAIASDSVEDKYIVIQNADPAPAKKDPTYIYQCCSFLTAP